MRRPCNSPLLSITILILTLLLTVSLTLASGGPGRKTGIIAAKGLVRGPNNQSIWVEFDTDGNVICQIGEAHGAPLLENIEKIYRWPYRPELQFSLYDLSLDDIELISDLYTFRGAPSYVIDWKY